VIDLSTIEQRIQAMPPLPTVAVKVLRLLEDPDETVEAVVDVIRLDPSLTLRVLKVCNSPYYGLSRQVHSLQDAVVLLGVDALVNMVLSTCVTSLLGRSCPGYRLEEGALWSHSVCCAIASELAAERVCPGLKGQAFTAGLLHDIGKVVLATYVDADFQQIQSLVNQESVAFHAAERSVIGVSHTETGAAVAEHWNLPLPLRNAIRYHHEPMHAPEDQALVGVVHLGNAVTTSLGFGIGADGLAMTLCHETVDQCGMTPSDMLALCALVLERYRQAQELLSSGGSAE